jgi:hypothetical protein
MEGGSKERSSANRAGVVIRGIDHLGETVAPIDVITWEQMCAPMVLIVCTPAERAFVFVEYVVIVGRYDLILDEGVLGDAQELVEYGIEEHGGGRTEITFVVQNVRWSREVEPEVEFYEIFIVSCEWD